ncbi:MAG: hypothetical protein ABJA74_02425 [Lapillicoccus sp.]
MTGVVLVVLVLVTLTYRWVVTTYTAAGGSYVAARENFGPVVALMLDYIVTVAVQGLGRHGRRDERVACAR